MFTEPDLSGNSFCSFQANEKYLEDIVLRDISKGVHAKLIRGENIRTRRSIYVLIRLDANIVPNYIYILLNRNSLKRRLYHSWAYSGCG